MIRIVGYDVINSEINFIFLIKPFLYTTKKTRRIFKYLVNEKSFQDEIKSIFHHFKYLENEKSFQDEIKSISHHFKYLENEKSFQDEIKSISSCG